VERDRAALAALRANVADLGLQEQVRIVPGDALRVLATGGPWDLILADPPYAQGQVLAVVAAAARVLSQAGVLALEHAGAEPSPLAPEGLALWKSRRYGGTSVTLYVRSSEEMP
jgi:16S rRNA (guanine966-N2)-methyltransferase